MECPSCRATVPPGGKFCNQCGKHAFISQLVKVIARRMAKRHRRRNSIAWKLSYCALKARPPK